MWFLTIASGVFGYLPHRTNGGLIRIDATKLAIMIVSDVALTVLLGWLVTRRIAYVRRIAESGLEVTGRIVSIAFFRDRGRVEYDFEFDGKTYHAGNAIWKNAETTRLKIGDELKLLVDPDRPSGVFISFLYCHW